MIIQCAVGFWSRGHKYCELFQKVFFVVFFCAIANPYPYLDGDCKWKVNVKQNDIYLSHYWNLKKYVHKWCTNQNLLSCVKSHENILHKRFNLLKPFKSILACFNSSQIICRFYVCQLFGCVSYVGKWYSMEQWEWKWQWRKAIIESTKLLSFSVYLGSKASLRFHLSMHLSGFLKKTVKTIIKGVFLNKQCRKHAVGKLVCKSSLCQFSEAYHPHRWI